MTTLATRARTHRRRLRALCALTLCALAAALPFACAEDEVVDPEAADQVLGLSITTSAAMVPTYLLTEMTAQAIPPGASPSEATAALAAFFLAEMKCVEVKAVGNRVDIKFLKEPPEDPPPEPTCTDEAKNGDETDTDCGGPTCGACGDGRACAVATDCASGACINAACAVPTCIDGIKNGTETGPDCGGACGPCPNGQACSLASDCTSGACVQGICQAPTCTDGLRNGAETGTDCGGGTCPGCADRSACNTAADCANDSCVRNVCQPFLCGSGALDPGETDIDCGGPCAPCADARACVTNPDCRSGICIDGTCQAPTCDDGVRNGAETGTDCGGPCAPCPVIEQEQEQAQAQAGEADAPSVVYEQEGDTPAPAAGDNPCLYHDYSLIGEASIEVISAAGGRLEARHTWRNLANGAAVISAGAGTMTWGEVKDIRRMSFQATWDSGDGPVQGSGNCSQRLVKPEAGIPGGIRVEGERKWTNTAGNWLLTLNGIEIKGGIAAPVRGSYMIRTAAYLSMRMRFEQLDTSTIQVDTIGRDGEKTFRVSTLDGAVIP
jgi:hypothetical protein